MRILITGATDGIGREAVRRLAADGHYLLLHGRDAAKLDALATEVSKDAGGVACHLADLSLLSDAQRLGNDLAANDDPPDVLINNAGVFKASQTQTGDGLDIRFAVNTIAPWILTRRLLPLMPVNGRVVNVSSAAQAPVSIDALGGFMSLSHGAAYAQSKLAITMWSRHMAATAAQAEQVIVAVNPASMLGTKMVKEAFGVDGGDVGIGADILVRAALSDEFADANGLYYDNDARRFDSPHPEGLDDELALALEQSMMAVVERVLGR